MWKHMTDASKRKEKQKWTIEKPKLDNARRLRGIFLLERERHHGQKSWSERGTKGASQAANATNEKYEKLEGQL